MIRNPTGQQYKGRKYADRYAAGLQESWGGEQADGSLLEVVVDTLDTGEGRRYQVMCVTTPADEREPVLELTGHPLGQALKIAGEIRNQQVTVDRRTDDLAALGNTGTFVREATTQARDDAARARDHWIHVARTTDNPYMGRALKVYSVTF